MQVKICYSKHLSFGVAQMPFYLNLELTKEAKG